MPQINLLPASVGTADAWANQGGSDKVDSVITSDGDAKYIHTSTLNLSQYFNHGGMPPAAEITAHTLRSEARKASGASGTKMNNVLFYDGNNTSEDQGLLTGSYANYDSVDLAVPGGGTWTSDIVNATEIGVSTWAVSGDQMRVTYLRWAVSYVPVSGGGMWLLAQWLPPIIAVASHCLSKLEIARILSSLKIQPSDKEDFARIIEAFKRRPRWA